MMKKNEIIKCLKENKNVTDYEITFKSSDSRELFYVLKHLEINRAVKVEEIAIEIYVDKGEYKGDSCVVVTSADNVSSLKRKIASAVKKAKVVSNKYYPLPKKTTNIKEKQPKGIDLNDVACKIAKAVYKADTNKNGWINSCEIFVSSVRRELLTSKGINHISYSNICQIEIIPTWKNSDEEFELLKFIETSDFNYSDITKQTKEILKLSKYRSEAVKASSINIPKDVKILVQGEMLRNLVNNMTGDATYEYLFLKQNHYKINDVISNTKFNLTLKPVIKGCIASSKYDGNGIVLKSKQIIKDGVLISNWGGVRFGHYLGVKNPTGSLPTALIDAPSYDYRKDKHIIVEAFSSPQLEGFSGYFGGEVRVALYYDGNKYIPITEFAISGNIYEAMKHIQFSKEKTSAIDCSGPKYFIFNGLSIN